MIARSIPSVPSGTKSSDSGRRLGRLQPAYHWLDWNYCRLQQSGRLQCAGYL